MKHEGNRKQQPEADVDMNYDYDYSNFSFLSFFVCVNYSSCRTPSEACRRKGCNKQAESRKRLGGLRFDIRMKENKKESGYERKQP